MGKRNILDNVEFLDKVRVHVYRGEPKPDDRNPLRVEFEPIDSSKQVVFDESALKKFNEILTEKAQQFEPHDPRLLSYIEEFAGRMTETLYKNGLVALEDLPECPDDPYAAIRKQFARK